MNVGVAGLARENVADVVKPGIDPWEVSFGCGYFFGAAGREAASRRSSLWGP